MSVANQLSGDQKTVLEENAGDEKTKSLLRTILEAEADLKKSRGRFQLELSLSESEPHR